MCDVGGGASGGSIPGRIPGTRRIRHWTLNVYAQDVGRPIIILKIFLRSTIRVTPPDR